MLFTRVLRKSISGRSQIAAKLSQPTWTVSTLFDHDTKPASKADAETISQGISADLLNKLLKQAGLNPVESGSEKEKALLNELEKQLALVEHIAAIPTEDLKPLAQLIETPLEATIELIEKHQEVAPETVGENAWNPTDLAAEKNGDFYVLKEGLRKED